MVKRKTYQRHEVGVYWVVDPDAALIEVWEPHDDRPRIVTDVLTWNFGDSGAELRLPLSELFAA